MVDQLGGWPVGLFGQLGCLTSWIVGSARLSGQLGCLACWTHGSVRLFGQ